MNLMQADVSIDIKSKEKKRLLIILGTKEINDFDDNR